MTARRAAPGFGVLDAVLVLAILGLVASIAWPEYQAVEHRRRFAERDVTLRAIVQAVQALPADAARPPVLAGAWNPPGIPAARQAPWAGGQEGWKRIPAVSPGAAWCSYQFVLDEARTPATLVVAADCDVDGDGVHHVKVQTWAREGKAFVRTGETTSPAGVL